MIFFALAAVLVVFALVGIWVGATFVTPFLIGLTAGAVLIGFRLRLRAANRELQGLEEYFWIAAIVAFVVSMWMTVFVISGDLGAAGDLFGSIIEPLLRK